MHYYLNNNANSKVNALTCYFQEVIWVCKYKLGNSADANFCTLTKVTPLT